MAGENLDLGDYNEAISGLAKALTMVRQAQLAADPLAASVELGLGAALAGSGHSGEATAHFRAALRINPQIALEARWAKPPMKEAFEKAKAAAGAPSAVPAEATPGTASSNGASANRSGGVKHDRFEEVLAARSVAPAKPAAAPAAAATPATAPTKTLPEPTLAPAAPERREEGPVTGISAKAMMPPQAGKALPITARVGSDVGTPARVMLFYRQAGESRYAEVPMASASEGFKAAIPAQDVRLPAVQYYVEARDAKNRPLARRGNPDRPLAIGVAEAPAEAAPAPARRKKLGSPPRPGDAAAPNQPGKTGVRAKKRGEDDENPFDSEHDPTKVVPKAPDR
jgi:hypothetical protein